LDKSDELIAKYDETELLDILQNTQYHSPELSETDDENYENGKRKVDVYDISWRSNEVLFYLYRFQQSLVRLYYS